MKTNNFSLNIVMHSVAAIFCSLLLFTACSSDNDEPDLVETEHSEYEEIAKPYLGKYACEDGITNFYAKKDNGFQCVGLKHNHLWFALYDNEGLRQEWISSQSLRNGNITYLDENGHERTQKIKNIRYRYIFRSDSFKELYNKVVFIFKLILEDDSNVLIPVLIDNENGYKTQMPAVRDISVTNESFDLVIIDDKAYRYDGSVAFVFDPSFELPLGSKQETIYKMVYNSFGHYIKLESVKINDGIVRKVDYVTQQVYWTADLNKHFDAGCKIEGNRISVKSNELFTVGLLITPPTSKKAEKWTANINSETGEIEKVTKNIIQ